MPDRGLKPGDIVYVYQYFAEGFANTWANGIWRDNDSIATAMQCPQSTVEACEWQVKELAIREEWVHLKTADNKEGWVLNDGNIFGQVCLD